MSMQHLCDEPPAKVKSEGPSQAWNAPAGAALTAMWMNTPCSHMDCHFILTEVERSEICAWNVRGSRWTSTCLENRRVCRVSLPWCLVCYKISSFLCRFSNFQAAKQMMCYVNSSWKQYLLDLRRIGSAAPRQKLVLAAWLSGQDLYVQFLTLAAHSSFSDFRNSFKH